MVKRMLACAMAWCVSMPVGTFAFETSQETWDQSSEQTKAALGMALSGTSGEKHAAANLVVSGQAEAAGRLMPLAAATVAIYGERPSPVSSVENTTASEKDKGCGDASRAGCWGNAVLSRPVDRVWDYRDKIGTVPAGIAAGVTYMVMLVPACVAGAVGLVTDIGEGLVDFFRKPHGGPYHNWLNAP